VFSLSFHYFLPYFLYLLTFLSNCSYLFSIQITFLPYFPYLFTIQLRFLPYFPFVFPYSTFLP
jgi:hypothetical protein